MYRNFTQLLERIKYGGMRRVMAVAAAEDEAVIQAALRAKREGIADVILIGNASKIAGLLEKENEKPSDYRVVESSIEKAGQAAVSLVREGMAHFLMKGLLDTKSLLGPVVDKENGLRRDGVMSHVAMFEIPNYHKLIVNTDGGMILYPSLEDKKSIIENAVMTLSALGYDCPKVAILAGVEKVNPGMAETVDAQALAAMNRKGLITGCVVEGPVSYDVALNAEIARHKGATYKHCGNYDVLVVPSLAAGNILGKSWTVTANALMAGIVVGAKVPVVLTSRGSSAEEKYLSIALAALTSTDCPEDPVIENNRHGSDGFD